ncbi:MAG: hypothetical protein SGJ07_15350 [Rhodospirillaceae bacterium]|nr:hypothetical protein [Rhodospirillaceae bacterium]
MLMTGPWFGNTFFAASARRLGVISIAAAMLAVSTMAAVAKHMHRNHPDGEQYPNPVLGKPFHDLLRYQN